MSTNRVATAIALLLPVALAQGASAQTVAPAPMVAIAGAVEAGDAARLATLVRGIVYGSGTPVAVDAFVGDLRGCTTSGVEAARATFVCGGGCAAPAYSVRARPVDDGFVLVASRFNFIRKGCGLTIQPAPLPARPQ